MVKIYLSGLPAVVPAVLLDQVEMEGHGLSCSLTQSPIEAGSVIADHAVFAPRQLLLSVWASNAPGSSVLPALPTAHTRAWQAFKSLHESLTFLDVYTDLEVYRGCLITAVGVQRRVDQSNAIRFNVTLEVPTLTETDLTSALADSVADSGSGTADLGTQGTGAL